MRHWCRGSKKKEEEWGRSVRGEEMDEASKGYGRLHEAERWEGCGMKDKREIER